MSTKTNNHSDHSSPNARPAQVKGSDFFPPGAGWNKTRKPDDTDLSRPRREDERPAERYQH
jgi:hypothetical protein